MRLTLGLVGILAIVTGLFGVVNVNPPIDMDHAAVKAGYAALYLMVVNGFVFVTIAWWRLK